MAQARWRRALDRWADTSDQEARDLRATHEEAGHAVIAEAPDRERVTVRGVLRTVTLRPRDGVPVLEAELSDGSGVVTLTWLGRRRIGGIDPGRSLRVTGRIGPQNGVRVMYNPRYELIP
ncbi:MAG: OB-fold nucleic acid binding domain-containing protein [Nocardioides sp.]|uniref:OB-fold nucleic acid binding domain-containing protein n=1 Tax=Nocardioides sp. TaxID=35761 RepID=UPI003EFF0F7A